VPRQQAFLFMYSGHPPGKGCRIDLHIRMARQLDMRFAVAETPADGVSHLL
jgi:hypothetical protein